VRRQKVLVLDFGSQYSQLIARRVREANVYCELVPGTIPVEEVRARNPRGLIFSGGPASVYDADAPHPARQGPGDEASHRRAGTNSSKRNGAESTL